MIRVPPGSTCTAILLPYTTRFQSLQRGAFGCDLGGSMQLSDFLFERLLVAEAEGIGTAFGLVDAALEDFEAREGVFDAVAIGHLAQLVAVLGAFEATRDARLARARFAQLLLQLGDIAFITGQRVVEDGDFGLEALGHVARPLLFDKRGGGEILAVLRQRE